MFWTSNGTGDGSAYTQAQTVEFFRTILSPENNFSGVLPNTLNKLTPSASGLNVTILSGAAIVYGFWFHSDANEVIAVPQPTIGTTGHRIVVRVNWSTQQARLTLLSSSNGVSAIPAAVSTPGTTYDLTIATLTIATGGVITLTDARTYATFSTNHVRRTGDVMTGSLTIDRTNSVATQGDELVINSDLPDIHLIDADAASNEKRWVFSVNSGDFSIATRTDANAAGATAMDVVRNGTAITEVDFPTGGTHLKSGGNTVWHAGNDGAGSGLDADTLDGLQASQLWRIGQRQGGNASDFTVAGSTNYTFTGLRPQFGILSYTGSLNPSAYPSVTFPSAFTSKPLVIITLFAPDLPTFDLSLSLFSVSASGFTAQIKYQGDGVGGTITSSEPVYIEWLALGVMA
jgi:hypothetical protein